MIIMSTKTIKSMSFRFRFSGRGISSLILFLLFSSTTLFAQPKQLFEQANELYKQQKYEEAIQKYEEILKSGYESGELYFNLGNAYYKAGKIQYAVLNYERAKKFLHDDDVQFNLELVNSQLIDKIEPVPRLFISKWIDSLLTLFSLQTLGWILYSLFLLTLAAFSLFLFIRSYEKRRIALMSGFIGSGLVVIFLIIFLSQSYKEANTQYAIVVAEISNIKSAPDTKGNDLFILHKGTKMEILDKVDVWQKIRIADGKVGWIKMNECEII